MDLLGQFIYILEVVTNILDNMYGSSHFEYDKLIECTTKIEEK
jgi:hypothetical protein